MWYFLSDFISTRSLLDEFCQNLKHARAPHSLIADHKLEHRKAVYLDRHIQAFPLPKTSTVKKVSRSIVKFSRSIIPPFQFFIAPNHWEGWRISGSESLICVAIVFTQFYVNISRGSIKVSLRS